MGHPLDGKAVATAPDPDRLGTVPRPSRHASWALGTSALVALLCWMAVGGKSPPPAGPLGYVPPGSDAVVHADVDALRQSALVQQLWPALGSSKELERLCGFDPLSQVRDALAFLAEGQGKQLGPFGLVARGDFDREALPACFERLMNADGAGAQLTRLDGVPALASAGGGSRALFVGDDAVAVGSEDAARSVLQAVQGETPSGATDPVLSRLWPRAGEGRALTVAFKVPPRFRKVIPAAAKRHLRAEVDEVRAAVLGATLRDPIELGLVVEMAGSDGARRSVEALQERIRDLRREPMVAFTVFGKILRRLRLAAHGEEIVATLKVPHEDVRKVAALLGGAPAGARAPQSADDAATSPGEAPGTVVRRQADEEPPSR